MSYEDFLDLVDKTFPSFNWRYGQCVMNVLYYAWKEKHDELADSEYDCYYDDSLTRITLEKLEKEWPHKG
jgi:hypothetical protein